MIKLEALRSFLTVAEAGNIKDAAGRLRRTQSAVSMTLSGLEAQLGGALFDGDRKNSLTDLGRFTAEAAEVLIRDHDRTTEMIMAYAQDRMGQLRLASVPSVATHLMPALLQGFVSARPKITVSLTDTDSAEVTRLVKTGQADLGLCGAPQDGAALRFELLFRDPFKLVCARQAPLCNLTRPVDWPDLAGAALILNEAARTLPMPAYARLAQAAQLTMRNVTSLLAMVQAGLGVTLLPSLACAALPEGVVALDMADQDAWRAVGLVRREAIAESPLARAFRTHLQTEAPALLASKGLAPFT
ncbi:MAG: LysR family transcriptional regulator [Albidovulum sp.]